jgi:hypothetical protein
MSSHVKKGGTATLEAIPEAELIKVQDFSDPSCKTTDLSSFLKDGNSTKEGFEEALSSFIDELHKRGTLKKVLLNLGLELHKLPTAYPPAPEERYIKKHPLNVSTTFGQRVSSLL